MGLSDPSLEPRNGTIREVIKTRVGSKGRIALTFEATYQRPSERSTPPRITARIFDPDRLDSHRRLLVGEITNRLGDKHLVLQLATPPTPPRYKQTVKEYALMWPKPNPPGQHTLENDDVSIELTCDASGLKGSARPMGYEGRYPYHFQLVLKKQMAVGKGPASRMAR